MGKKTEFSLLEKKHITRWKIHLSKKNYDLQIELEESFPTIYSLPK
jgi:hypothetical protein